MNFKIRAHEKSPDVHRRKAEVLVHQTERLLCEVRGKDQVTADVYEGEAEFRGRQVPMRADLRDPSKLILDFQSGCQRYTVSEGKHGKRYRWEYSQNGCLDDPRRLRELAGWTLGGAAETAKINYSGAAVLGETPSPHLGRRDYIRHQVTEASERLYMIEEVTIKPDGRVYHYEGEGLWEYNKRDHRVAPGLLNWGLRDEGILVGEVG